MSFIKTNLWYDHVRFISIIILIISYQFVIFIFLSTIFSTHIQCYFISEITENTPGFTIKAVTKPFGLSEGPHWDHGSQKLFFVDIMNQLLCRLDPISGSVTHTYIENGPVGVAIPVEDEPNKFVAGSGTDFTLVTWDSEFNLTKASTQVFAAVDKGHKGNRWNDGKVDSSGRFWGGTMGAEINGKVQPNQASFYRIGKDFVPHVEISPVSISNGLAWSKEDDIFYYIDSPTREIAAYDYEPVSGTISNKRIVFDFEKNNITEGVPDGMTIDTDGNLWIAVFNGHVVLNVNPKTGKLIRIIRLPAKRVTSVAFGGPNLQKLYVTTSSYGLSEEEKKQQPKAGSVFEVTGLGVNGLLANSFQLCLNNFELIIIYQCVFVVKFYVILEIYSFFQGISFFDSSLYQSQIISHCKLFVYVNYGKLNT